MGTKKAKVSDKVVEDKEPIKSIQDCTFKIGTFYDGDAVQTINAIAKALATNAEALKVNAEALRNLTTSLTSKYTHIDNIIRVTDTNGLEISHCDFKVTNGAENDIAIKMHQYVHT